MTTNVSLPPALEHFARECVAEGRYANISEVVRTGLRLLQRQEDLRRQLTRSLDEAVEEADREGWFTIEEEAAEMDAIIDAAEAIMAVDVEGK